MMKTNQYILRTVAAAALALPVSLFMLSSCSDEDHSIPTDTQGQVRFTAVVSDAPVSRAEGNAYTPATGNLTVYGNSWASDTKATYGYNSNTEGWTCSSVEPLFWKDITGEGEYLFYAVAPKEPGDATAVLIDQSSGANYTASDLLVARTVVAAKEVEVPFVLKHVLSQLEINLTTSAGDEKLSAEELASVVVTIDGLKNAYTLTAGTTADVPATVQATGDAVNGAKPCRDEGKNTFRFITVPQAVTADPGLTLNFTVSIGGNEVKYVYNHKPTFTAGKKNVYNITITKSNLKVSGVTVTDWAAGESAEATLTITTTGTAETPEGEASTFSNMILWLADGVLTDFSTATSGRPLGTAHSYTKDAAGTWTSENPIYLDEMTGGSVIYATATNATEPDIETGFSDYLVAGPVSAKGGAAAIEFRHALAQLTVKLTKDADFPADITTATITTPDMLKGTAMATDADGYLYFVARGTETVTYTVASESSYLVVPQTLAAGATFVVTLKNGNPYEAKLAKDVTLEAGKNTTVTLTLKETETAVKATVTPWGEAASVSAEVHLASVTTGGNQWTPEVAGELTLAYTGMASPYVGVYTYANSAWTGTAPLYWDEIPETDYATDAFAATFTPTAEAILEKDILMGQGTTTAWGQDIDLSLSHVMAKVTVTISAGEGIDDLTTEITGRTIRLKASSSVELGANYQPIIALATDAANVAFTNEEPFFVAPQTLSDANTIVLTRENGNTYTIKLCDLKDAQDAAIFTNGIEAGQHYAITLTVNETSVGISASIAEWTDVNGSGTVTPDFE